jgi:hypothetical protein
MAGGDILLHAAISAGEAEPLATTRAAIRGRITRLGIRKRDDSWNDAEIALLRSAYAEGRSAEDIGLPELAAKLGRPKANVCRKARQLELTDQRRPRVRERKVRSPKYASVDERREAQGLAARERWAANGHPRGMLGKRHTPEARAQMARTTAKVWRSLPPETRNEYVDRSLKARVAKYGSLAPRVDRGTWKAGWREIGDRRHYFRSRWEANYARYLEWLKQRGDILEWEYEPETFWFDKIKRGCRSYLPDFRVHELNGNKPLHEVKGWMDARSKTTLRRMAKYHPGQKIVLIRQKEYSALSRFSALIEGWE